MPTQGPCPMSGWELQVSLEDFPDRLWQGKPLSFNGKTWHVEASDTEDVPLYPAVSGDPLMLNIDVRCTSTQDGRRNDIRKGDVDPVLGALQAFPKECRGAIWQAVKRSLTTLRKELAKSIGEVSYIKKGVIMDSISRVQRYGSSRAGSRKETNSDVVMGYINVSSRQLPLDVYKLRPNRPTHPKGRSRNMSLSGYQIGPREPVRYKKRTSDRSAGLSSRERRGYTS